MQAKQWVDCLHLQHLLGGQAEVVVEPACHVHLLARVQVHVPARIQHPLLRRAPAPAPAPVACVRASSRAMSAKCRRLCDTSSNCPKQAAHELWRICGHSVACEQGRVHKPSCVPDAAYNWGIGRQCWR